MSNFGAGPPPRPCGTAGLGTAAAPLAATIFGNVMPAATAAGTALHEAAASDLLSFSMSGRRPDLDGFLSGFSRTVECSNTKADKINEMTPAIHPSPLDSALAALAAGQHRDPFAVLGPHVEEGVIRAFNPAARSIDLLLPATGEVRAMTRRSPHGVFEAQFEAKTDTATGSVPDYRLRITYPGDVVVDVDDPYRYGRVLTDFDLHLLAEGTHHRAFEKLGAHRITWGGTVGIHFAVWAPNADRVSVVGDFNAWDGRVHPMRLLMPNGVWEIFIPELQDGEKYKFEIRTRSGALLKKTDPFGFAFEVPPQSAAVVRDISHYSWRDARVDGGAARGGRRVRSADVDLRSAPRIVGARARRGQSLPDVSRDGVPARAVRERRWASRTSSCCR